MRKFLPFASSFLLCLAFIRYSWGWFALIALIPLVWSLEHASAKKSDRSKTLLLIWLAGLVFYLITTSFVLKTDSANWLGSYQTTVKAMSVISWLIVSLTFSTGWLLFGWFAQRFQKHWQHRLTAAFWLPTFWIIGDVARSFLMSIVSRAPQATIGHHWNFGSLGLAATATPIAAISRLVGLYGLAGLVLAINVGFVWLLRRHWFAPATLLVATIGLSVLAQLSFSSTTGELNVTAVQLRTKEDAYQAPLTASIEQSPPATYSNVVVFPEYASLFETTSEEKARTILKLLFGNHTGVAVYTREQPEERFATKIERDEIVYRDQDGTVIATQAKRFLIPGGEYMPRVFEIALQMSGRQKLIEGFNRLRTITPAETNEMPVSFGHIKIGALACSGLIAPQLYQKITDRGANILVDSASLSSFAASPSYFEQTKQMARFHAIANARPFIQATQGGYSYIIDQDGRFVNQTHQQDLQVIQGRVRPSSASTPYTRFGEWTTIIAFGAVAVLSWRNLKSRVPKVKPKA